MGASECKSNVYHSPDDVAIQVFLNTLRSKMQILLHDDDGLESATGLIEAMDLSAKERKMRKRKEPNPYIARTKEEQEFDEKTNEQIKQITARLSCSEDQIQSHVASTLCATLYVYYTLYIVDCGMAINWFISTVMILAHSLCGL